MKNTGIHTDSLNSENTFKLPETVEIDIEGKAFTCGAFIKTEKFGNVPVLDIELMSEERERELIETQKRLHPDLYEQYYETYPERRKKHESDSKQKEI